MSILYAYSLYTYLFCVTGPRLDWDPDVLALLDSDNDEPMEDELDDDFIALANDSGDEDFPTLGSTGKDVSDRQRKWIEEQMMGNSG